MSAEGYNAVPPVRLEPANPQSRVKHSTTEPLQSSSEGCEEVQAHLNLGWSPMQ